MDLAILLLLWLSFASLVTLHVALSMTVGHRRGKLLGWLALLAVPLAPYLGFTANAKTRSGVWCLLLASYLVLLFFATR